MIRSPIARTGPLKPALAGNNSANGCILSRQTGLLVLIVYSKVREVCLSEKWKQFVSFRFYFKIAGLKYAAVIDKLLESLFGERRWPTGLTEMPSTESFIVLLNRQDESRCGAIRANDSISCRVVADASQPWKKRLINSKRGGGHWQVYKKRFTWCKCLKVRPKNIVRSSECVRELRAYQSEQASQFISFFLFLTPLLRFGLLPRHPNSYKNSPYRTYSLQPSWPVSAGQVVVLPRQKRNPCQRSSSVENEAGRGHYLAKFRCHSGILA